MSITLSATIDGQHVPLTACDWVLWGPCGCPWGVSAGWAYEGEESVWKAHYHTKRDRDRARRKGARLELMTHARWCAEVADRMKVRCPHA
jgi:hypothetical protein